MSLHRSFPPALSFPGKEHKICFCGHQYVFFLPDNPWETVPGMSDCMPLGSLPLLLPAYRFDTDYGNIVPSDGLADRRKDQRLYRHFEAYSSTGKRFPAIPVLKQTGKLPTYAHHK